jgi:hypothetical protein
VPDTFTGIKGNILNPPKVLDPSGKGDADWFRYKKGEIKHVQPINLAKGKWGMCYCAEDFDPTTRLFETM